MTYKFVDENKKHLHTLRGEPLLGTSTVTGVMSKPLTWWAAGLAVGKLGWTNGKIKVAGRYQTVPDAKRLPIAEAVLQKLQGLPTKDYLKLLDEAYKAHSEKLKDSAEVGIDRHELLEKVVKLWLLNGGIPTPMPHGDPLVLKFIEWSLEHIERFILSEAHCYSERLWLGGIVDCVAKLKTGDLAVIDFKSSKEAYDNQWVQVSLYDIQLEENGAFDASGVQIVPPLKATRYLIVPFGAPEFVVEERTDIGGIRKAAEACVTLYKFTQDNLRTN